MTLRLSLAASSLALLAAVTPVVGQSFVYDNSVPYSAEPGLTTYQTDFNDVGGMVVEWNFVGGGGDSALWGDQGDYLGFIDVWGVSSEDFFLGGIGAVDTYFGTWHLIANDLQSFTVYGAPGLGVFDIVSGAEVSPGSSDGHQYDYECSGVFFLFPFCLNGGTDYWNTTVTYSNPVGIGGDAPAGDLYATLNVNFGNGFNAGNDDCHLRRRDCNYAQFFQDMDNGPEGGSIGIPTETVPEPATMTLLVTGLAALAGSRRRLRA